MFYHLCFLCFLSINVVLTQPAASSCSALNRKLNKYNIYAKHLPDKGATSPRLCQGTIENACCSPSSEDQLQNATVIELYQLFELYSMNIYEPLLRLTNDFNGKRTVLVVID